MGAMLMAPGRVGGASGAADRAGTISRTALVGVATWAAGFMGDGRTVLLVAGLPEPPTGALPVHHDGGLVLVSGPDVALVAVAETGTSAASWTLGASAVRSAIARVDLPPGSAAVVEAALATAPESGGQATASVLAGIEAGLRHERRVLAARLHDGPVQDLTAAQLLLDSALQGDIRPDEVRMPLEEGLRALGAAMTGARELMGDLVRRHADDGGA